MTELFILLSIYFTSPVPGYNKLHLVQPGCCRGKISGGPARSSLLAETAQKSQFSYKNHGTINVSCLLFWSCCFHCCIFQQNFYPITSQLASWCQDLYNPPQDQQDWRCRLLSTWPQSVAAADHISSLGCWGQPAGQLALRWTLHSYTSCDWIRLWGPLGLNSTWSQCSSRTHTLAPHLLCLCLHGRNTAFCPPPSGYTRRGQSTARGPNVACWAFIAAWRTLRNDFRSKH